jgi:uncharacterized protein YaaN involved in tellurite resistance
MFATKKELKQIYDKIQRALVVSDRNNAILEKRIEHLRNRIQILEGYRIELGKFLDRLLKATGYKFDYKLATTTNQSYEIVKIKKGVK